MHTPLLDPLPGFCSSCVWWSDIFSVEAAGSGWLLSTASFPATSWPSFSLSIPSLASSLEDEVESSFLLRNLNKTIEFLILFIKQKMKAIHIQFFENLRHWKEAHQGCGSGSGSGFQISLDPVSAQTLENCRKVSKSDLSEENLTFMTKDRQKMKKATISY